MVSPGKYIAFLCAANYIDRVGENAAITIKAREHLENFPNSGTELMPGIKLLHLTVNDQTYALVFQRRKQALGFMYVAELPEEAAQLDAYIADVKLRYGKKL